MPRKDETGNRYGRLLVVSYSHTQADKNVGMAAMWNCLCDCGTTIVVEGKKLRNNNTRSCGCLKSENLTGRIFGNVEGNVQWVHKTINKMKMDLPQDDFIKFCKLVANKEPLCG